MHSNSLSRDAAGTYDLAGVPTGIQSQEDTQDHAATLNLHCLAQFDLICGHSDCRKQPQLVAHAQGALILVGNENVVLV